MNKQDLSIENKIRRYKSLYVGFLFLLSYLVVIYLRSKFDVQWWQELGLYMLGLIFSFLSLDTIHLHVKTFVEKALPNKKNDPKNSIRNGIKFCYAVLGIGIGAYGFMVLPINYIFPFVGAIILTLIGIYKFMFGD